MRRVSRLRFFVLAVVVSAAAVALCATAAPAAALVSTGDGGWQWQAPLPQGNFINGVAYSDPVSELGKCFEVGNGGTILRSTDGGLTWEGRQSGTADVLNGIAFAGAQDGWAVGETGTVVRTTDGGDTWALQDMYVGSNHVTYGLHGVAAVPVTTDGVTTYDVWAVGVAGKIYASTDGGVTWAEQTSTVTSDLYGVDFVDATHGYASTAGGVVRTADGGATWESVPFGLGGAMFDVAYPDLQHIYVAGGASGGGLVDYSTNGGAGWNLDWPSSGPLHGIDFADGTAGTTGWAAGQSALLQTTDSGTLWSKISLPSNPSPSFQALACSDSSHALAAGLYGVTWSTTDGATWADRGGNDLNTHLAGIEVVGGGLWAAGTDGSIRYSSDGGATWDVQRGDTYPQTLTTILMRDATHGWAGGYNDCLYTTDGGSNWQSATVPDTGWGIADIAFVSDTHGFAVGGNGLALESTDGGQNWFARADISALETTPSVQGVTFAPDGLHGWIFGYDMILATSNGGTSWAAQDAQDADYVYDGTFLTAKVGWVGEGNGRIMHTTDGGAHWTHVSVGGNNVQQVTFSDRLHGWAVTDRGQVFATPDGGKHWLAQDARCAHALADVAFTDAYHGFVAGDGGSLLTTSTAGYGDFTAPTTRAYAASVKRGHKATLPWRVTDRKPTCGWASVTVKVKTRGGKTVKTFAAVVKPANARQTSSFTCKLKRGTYRVWVYAIDVAGHKQTTITKANLTVK